MRNLSKKYAKEYNRPLMRPLHCRVKWGLINDMASNAQNHSVTSADHAPTSSIRCGVSTVDGKEVILSNVMYPETHFAAFEPDFWVLDGSMPLAHENADGRIKPDGEAGWISREICGDDCVFPAPQRLDITFEKNDGLSFNGLTDLYGLLITFNPAKNEYAREFTLTGIDKDNGRHTLEIKNTDQICAVNLNWQEIIAFEIKITKWSRPRRRARIYEIAFGLYNIYDSRSFVNLDEHTVLNQISSELPISTLDFTIIDREKIFNSDNKKGISRFLSVRQPVSVTWIQQLDDGKTEEIPGGAYFLKRWGAASERGRYSLSAESLLGFMDDIYYRGKYSSAGVKASTLMEEVLQSAFPLGTGANGLWDLSEVKDAARDVLIQAPLPKASHKDCLMYLAQACGCVVDTYRGSDGAKQGSIVVRPLDTPDTDGSAADGYCIGLSKIFDNPPVSGLKSVLREVQCNYYNYSTKDAEEKTVYEMEVNITDEDIGKEFICEYKNPAEVNVDNIYINEEECNSIIHIGTYAAIIKLTETGSKTIKIEGSEYNLTNARYGTGVIDNNMTGETIIIENPLISSAEMAKNICKNLSKELSSRNEYEIEIKRDFRPQMGDIVALEKQGINSRVKTNVRLLETKRSLTGVKQYMRLREVDSK